MNIIFGGHGFLGKNLELQGERPSKQECNLCNFKNVYYYLSKFQEEKDLCIINLAAKTGGFLYNSSRNFEQLCDNSLIALNILKAIKYLNLDCYYLYISSVCAYDESNVFLEDNIHEGRPNKFNLGYGFAKRFGVMAVESFLADNPRYEDRISVLIPSNLYGPHDLFDIEKGHVMSTVIKKIYCNINPIHILGNPSNQRNFLYVKDLAKIIELFVDKKVKGLYNIGSGYSTSIGSLVRRVAEESGRDIRFSFPQKDYKPSDRIVITEKFKRDFPHFEFTPLIKGIRETIEWYKGEKLASFR